MRQALGDCGGVRRLSWRPVSPRDLGDAATVWREVADGRQREGDLLRLGDAERRLADVLELQGRWQEVLASQDRAATAFTAGQGQQEVDMARAGLAMALEHASLGR
jgi:hypothetical protein